MEPVFTYALALRPGDVVSAVGCGGKTTLLQRLAAENRARPVLLSTTTKIFPPPEDLVDRWAGEPPLEPGVNLMGDPMGPKLGAPPAEELARRMPDHGLTLLESDGSRGLPLKGWASWEPVIHEATTITVGVCTLWPVGRPCGEEIIHRSADFYRLTGAAEGEPVTLEHVADMLLRPEGMFHRARGRRALFINQAESPQALELARALADRVSPGLDLILAGSVRQGIVKRIGGRT